MYKGSSWQMEERGNRPAVWHSGGKLTAFQGRVTKHLVNILCPSCKKSTVYHDDSWNKLSTSYSVFKKKFLLSSGLFVRTVHTGNQDKMDVGVFWLLSTLPVSLPLKTTARCSLHSSAQRAEAHMHHLTLALLVIPKNKPFTCWSHWTLFFSKN